MTCIVGIRHENKVVMAADQFLGHGGLRLLSAQKKIIRVNDMLIGVSGRPREANLLKHFLVLPEDSHECPESYIVKDVVPALRTMLREHGALSKENELEGCESYFFIGYKSRLFEISSTYQVTETVDDYAATGSGMYFALGSLYSSQGQPPKDRVITAIKAASAHCPTVGGDIQVEVL